MSDIAPATTAETALPAPPPASPGLVSRRALIGGGAGLAGLGGLLATGLVLRPGTPMRAVDQRQAASHLLRRAGFAPSPAEVDAAVKAGVQVSTENLLHPENVSDASLEARLASDNFDLTQVVQIRRWWLVRMVNTKRPLVEKMTLFWHGLLTSSFRKLIHDEGLMYTQNQFLRTHALGNLRDLLVGISKDGAMLKWLDGTGSSKHRPNENYARELMELFTMGVGKYSEKDVSELARAMTGWNVDTHGTVSFHPRSHDAGTKTILGHTGNYGLEASIDIILSNPATPRHVATRLWEYFVYPDPSAADLQPVVDAYWRSHYDIRSMLAAVLGAPQFYSNRAYRALVKSPVELVAGVARQHGVALDLNTFSALETMGQSLFDPPNVAGWPGGPAWLSTGSWMARMRWLLAMSDQAAHGSNGIVRAVAQPPAEAVDRAVAGMLDGYISAPARQAIVDHVATLTDPRQAAADLFFLVAATPEHQLA